MIYRFEIYDKKLHQWYVDFITKDAIIADEYFNVLLRTYKDDKSVIRVITLFDF